MSRNEFQPMRLVAGRHRRVVIALAPCAVECDVADESGVESAPVCPAVGVRAVAEAVCHAESCPQGVDARVGVVGIAVREMRQPYASGQGDAAAEAVFQQQVEVDVGVGVRAEAVHVGVVKRLAVGDFFPAERSPEVPFVVEA